MKDDENVTLFRWHLSPVEPATLMWEHFDGENAFQNYIDDFDVVEGNTARCALFLESPPEGGVTLAVEWMGFDDAAAEPKRPKLTLIQGGKQC